MEGRFEENRSGWFGSLKVKIRDYGVQLWEITTRPQEFFRNLSTGASSIDAAMFFWFWSFVPAFLLYIVLGLAWLLVLAAGLTMGDLGEVFRELDLSLGTITLMVLVGLVLVFLIAPALTLVSVLLTLAISACIQHVFIWMFVRDTRKPLNETIRLIAYANTPPAAINSLGSIFLGILTIFIVIPWVIFLTVIGIKEVYGTTLKRATLAVGTPILISIVAIVGTAVYIYRILVG